MSMIRDPFVTSYPLRIRESFIAVILGLTLVAFVFPRFASVQGDQQLAFAEQIETFDIPATQQFTAPPPLSRPSIPIESDDEDFAEDITIEETGLDDFAWDAPPPPPENGPTVRFIAFEVPPEPIGGYGALLKRLVYPRAAAAMGLEGTVIVQAFVDKTGKVTQTFVLEGLPATGLDEAAVAAVKLTLFKPALQRDLPIGVWITFPIRFQLTG